MQKHGLFSKAMIFVGMLLLVCCTKGENKSETKDIVQKYAIQRIVLGTFKVDEGKPYGTADEKGVHWMTMGKAALAIDDSGRIYVLSGSSVFTYGENGKFNKEIVLRDISSEYRAGSIEVSADGTRLYITLKKKDESKNRIYDNSGNIVESKGNYDSIRRSCKDNFLAEKYGVNKNAIEKNELHALDKNLKLIKDLKNYYLPNMRLNERPLGFFDASLNYYFTDYMPSITKIDVEGKVVSKKKILVQGENCRLVGIDADGNLYALVFTDNHNNIIKVNKNLETVASISLESLAKDLENVNSIQSDGSEVQNYLVTCNGTIYFIPNYYDSINPAFAYAYQEYRKRGEYVIYKIEHIKN